MTDHPAPNPADAQLVGQRVRLRLIEPGDYVGLRQLEMGGEMALRWRHSGQQIPLESYSDSLWAGVLSIFIFESTIRVGAAGVVTAYSADPRNGHVSVAAARLKSSANQLSDSLDVGEALALFIDFLFQGWNFRKVYFEAAELNLTQFASFFELLQPEARYVEHIYLADRWWDLHVKSVWRADWPQIRQ